MRYAEVELIIAAGEDFDLDAAKAEVQEKTDEQLETETAFKWGGRAVACFELFRETENPEWYFRGLDYRHEALEHASLVGDLGETVKKIEYEIDQYMPEKPDLQGVGI